MTKRILSIAAAAAVMTSGAVAFDTNPAGDILNQDNLLGSYHWDKENMSANNALRPSVDGKGDAIMFPLFTQEDDWGTEMVVRNNTAYATVAKVVVLAADDSREVIDFNIYLTPYDVFRFKIEDGKLTSEDGSVIVQSSADYTSNTFASPSTPLSLDVKDVNGVAVDTGYVLVLGMGQSERRNAYDHDTQGIVDLYTNHLDDNRGEWRGNYWKKGVYINEDDPIEAPNMASHCRRVLSLDGTEEYQIEEGWGDWHNRLCDVRSYALSGQVRIYNGTDTTRDMLLNAVAAENYTEDGVIMLWAPGEYATWHDRALDAADEPTRGCTEVAQNANRAAAYNCSSVGRDARNFTVDFAYYTYANASANPSVQNKMIVTQPHKRTMVQLQESNDSTEWKYTDYWNQTCDYTEPAGKPLTGLSVGFTAVLSIFDEDENKDPGNGNIHSPADSTGHCTEIALLTDLEDLAYGDYSDKNGYVVVDFDTDHGLPAIITQQTASMVNGDGHINWVPSITKLEHYYGNPGI